MMLEVENIDTYYGQSHILEGVSLAVEEGESVALIGRNGVGKTTTLRSILQLTPPTEGSITFRGEDITGMETFEVAQRGVGWVPEERRMFAHLTVDENIEVSTPPEADLDAAYDLAYETFPDLEQFRDKDAGTLSGGQQQMLAIARGLVGQNDLLLIDEPSEGLAPLIVEQVSEALEALRAETTMLLVEQNFEMAMDLTDRFYLLDHGQVVESGQSDDVSADDEFIQRYLSA